MQTVKITKDIEHAGLHEGDLLSVDELSAAKLIERGDAEKLDAAETEAVERVETIDDIVDPAARRHKAVMTVSQVADADPGPQAKPKAETPSKQRDKPARVASGAHPAGGDADGGAS